MVWLLATKMIIIWPKFDISFGKILWSCFCFMLFFPSLLVNIWFLSRTSKLMMVGTPVTPSCKIHRTPCSTPGGPKVREEKILVTVRMRPLNSREQAMYDLIAWECVDENSIIFKNPNHERPATTYVFGMSSTPQQFYSYLVY